MAEQAAKDVNTIVKAPAYVIQSLISSFADANFIPSSWDSAILPAIEQNNHLLNSGGIDNQWPRFFSELCTLNYTDLAFIKRILSKDYLDKYFEKNPTPLEYLSLLNLYQTVACRRDNPLKRVDCQSHIAKAIEIQSRSTEYTIKDDVECALGSEVVLTGVISKFGHIIPHVVIQNKNSGDFVDVSAFNKPNDQSFIQLEDIKCKDDERM